ncbi:unnamed protein product [Schistocephalus solidus]|uniref:TPR_REGION domain-containing protein n=1 Tax=Schistocephalus solidus TaxID=70667 RepID=A0A183SZM2_SCHSO|nr:unnamed protein product [Schistocephalus solidus]
MSDTDDCAGIPLPVGGVEKTRVCFRLGQAPDLSSGSLRGVLEAALQCATVGTTVRVTAEVIEPKGGSPVEFTFNARLDRMLLQPLFRPTPISDEEASNEKPQEDKKTVQKPKKRTPPSNEGPGSEGTWPAGLSRLWLERALALKARGTWLLTGSHEDAAGDGELTLSFRFDRLDGAFRCYSRALRLVTLLGTLAHLPTKEGPEASPLMETIVEAPGAASEAEYADLDKPTLCIKPMPDAVFRVDMIVLSKLHISLLSNMALCQLKAGSNAFAVKQCTAALELVPSDMQLLSDKEGEQTDGITLRDVEKVLFRRGSAYAASDFLDEARDDLTRVLQMNPANQPAKRLLEDVQRRLASVHNLMAERLRRAL